MPLILCLFLCSPVFAARQHLGAPAPAAARPKASQNISSSWASAVPEVTTKPTSLFRSVRSLETANPDPLQIKTDLISLYESKQILYCLSGKFTNLQEKADALYGALPPALQRDYTAVMESSGNTFLEQLRRERDQTPRMWDQLATQFAHTPAGREALLQLGSLWMNIGKPGIAVVYAEELWRDLPQTNRFSGLKPMQLVSLARIYGNAGIGDRFSEVWKALKPYLGTKALLMGNDKILEETDRSRFLKTVKPSLQSELLSLALSPDNDRREIFRRIIRHIPKAHIPFGESLCPLLEGLADLTRSEVMSEGRKEQIYRGARVVSLFGQESFDFFVSVFEKGDEEQRAASLHAIVRLGRKNVDDEEHPPPSQANKVFHDKGISFLLGVTKTGSPSERAIAWRGLFDCGASSKDVAAGLIADIDNPATPSEQRTAAASTLAQYLEKERGLAPLGTLNNALKILTDHHEIPLLTGTVLGEAYRLKGRQSYPELIARLDNPEYSERVAASIAIRAIGKDIGPAVLQAFRTQDQKHKIKLAELLGNVGETQDTLPALLAELAAASPERNPVQTPREVHTISTPASALERKNDAAQKETRRQFALSDYRQTLLESLRKHVKEGDTAAVPTLLPLLAEKRHASDALEALRTIHPKMPQDFAPHIVKLINDPKLSGIAPEAEEWIKTLDDKGLSIYLAGLSSPNKDVRIASAKGIEQTGTRSAEVAARLIPHLSETGDVQYSVLNTLCNIPGAKEMLKREMVSNEKIRTVGLGIFYDKANAPTRKDVPFLESLLTDKVERVRQDAASLLLDVEGNHRALEMLLQEVNAGRTISRTVQAAHRKPNDEEDTVIHSALSAFTLLEHAKHKSQEAYDAIRSIAKDPTVTHTLRQGALDALVTLGGNPQEILPLLLPGLTDSSAPVRLRTLRSIENLKSAAKPAEKAIVQCLSDKDEIVRSDAAYALGALGTLAPETKTALLRVFRTDKDPAPVMAALEALAKTERSPEARKKLLLELREGEERADVIVHLNRKLQPKNSKTRVPAS